MNGKKSKRLRRKAENMLIEWLRTMTPDSEDTSKINRKNLHEFLPEQTHVYGMGRILLSAYSLRWFNKKIKRNPDITLEELLRG